MHKLIVIYLIAINIVSFMVFAFDKLMAKYDRSRVSEKRLHLLSILGGFIGSSLSMLLFNHKLRKSSFFSKHFMIVILWVLWFVFYFTQIDELNFVV